MTIDLHDIKAVVCDMDGVLWRGDTPLPSLVAFFDFLNARHLPFALATNNSRRTQVEYVAKLAKMGVEHVREDHIMTSGIATAGYLQTILAPHARVHVLGGNGLRFEMLKAGFELADDDVQAVVVGIDLELTYDKAHLATRLLLEGARFIGTNGDKTLPLETGAAPGAGSIIAMLETASGVTPTIIGKPFRAMFDVVVRQMGVPAAQTLMIGDRLNTDIEGAYQAGLKTALVLTGTNTRADAEANAIQPDVIFEDLTDLLKQWS